MKIFGIIFITGSTGCTDCPAGTKAPVAGSDKCLTCPAGTYSPVGSDECIECPAGQFSDSEGVIYVCYFTKLK